MSQDQPFICKSKLGGIESLGISKMGQTVLARVMESQIWHQSSSSGGGRGGGLSKETVASTHPDARHFSRSLCTTGAFQAAIPVLELSGSKSEWVSRCVGSPRGTA